MIMAVPLPIYAWYNKYYYINHWIGKGLQREQLNGRNINSCIVDYLNAIYNYKVVAF